MLEPITIPESNFPVKKEHVTVAAAVLGAEAETSSDGGPSRRKAVFISADQK